MTFNASYFNKTNLDIAPALTERFQPSNQVLNLEGSVKLKICETVFVLK